MTAVSVARECGMVGQKDKVIVVEANACNKGGQPDLNYQITSSNRDERPSSGPSLSLDMTKPDYHFAMSGKTWSVLHSSTGAESQALMDRLVRKGTIFARMAPDQKAQLVESYQVVSLTTSIRIP